MEEKPGVWQANFTSGMIFGLIGITYSLIIYFLDLTFNKVQGPVFMIIQLALLFYFLKSYRDNFLHGYITFGQSVSAGTVIFVYYAVIMGIYVYILYAFIDTGLIEKQLAFTEVEMLKKELPQAAIDAGMAFQAKIIKPAILAPMSFLGSMIGGVIMSLIISIFVRKEGNPLLDSPEN